MTGAGFRLTILSAGLVLAYLLIPLSATAQVTGTISGYVTDPSKAAVPNAQITAIMVQRSTSSSVTTNGEGFYNFVALEPGVYKLTAEKAGFERLVRSGIILTVSQHVRVDMNLRLGSVATAVTVTGAAPLVDTTSGTDSGLVDDRRVVDLPLNGRNVISLAEIMPGVLRVCAPQNLTDVRSGPTMDVNGGRRTVNAFMFDGAWFNNPSRDTGMNYPPPDALQEFRIQTADFSAEYGRSSGSEVEVVSKAGTNEFHGSVWEFLRNDALNARNFFAATVPAIKQNQFGGAAGGPIKKNKLFFFGSYQALRSRPQAVPEEAFVPSAAERSGDFTSLLPGTVLTDPVNTLTGQPLTDSAGQTCVANNIINPNCISPVAKNLLPFVPQTASGTLVSLGANPTNEGNYFGRLDWNVSPKQSLFGHAYVDHNYVAIPFTSCTNIAGYAGQTEAEETDMVTLNDTYILNPEWVNQSVVSFLRTTSGEVVTKNVPPSDDGIDMPQYQPEGVVGVSLPGLFTLGAGSYVVFKNNTYQFRDDVSWTVGRHDFKFGGELFRVLWLQRFIGGPTFTFNGSRSGNAFADFLLGSYSTLSGEFGLTTNDDRSTEFGLFFQDQFKVKPRLTLTYGVRYEPDLFWHDVFNRINAVVPGVQSTVDPDAPPGILFPGDLGMPSSITKPDLNNIAPRIGFAWDVFGDGRTSVRGAYGVFYDQVNADTLAQQNAPFSGTFTESDGLIADPFASTGTTAPPVNPTGKFGCVKIAAPPGVTCPLFPLPISGFFMSRNLQTPYTQSTNLTVERQLTPNTMVSAAYIGEFGTKLALGQQYNPAQFIPGTSYDAATGFENTLSTNSSSNEYSRTIFEPGILSPASSYLLGNSFRSWYNSFQAQVIKRFSRSFSVNGAYTLSKSLSNFGSEVTVSSETTEQPDPFDLQHSRGLTPWDRGNAFVASWLWSPIPKSNGRWKNRLIGGWSFQGITTLQSGLPLTFLAGPDVAVDGTGGAQTAFLNGQPIARSSANRGQMVAQFFNTAAFVNPLCTFVAQPFNPQVIQQENCTPFGIKYSLLGHYGQSGIGVLSGPALSNTDFSAIKDFAVGERYRVQFRAELFNVFNQVNFSNPDVTTTDASFGEILSASSGRVIQFALKFLW